MTKAKQQEYELTGITGFHLNRHRQQAYIVNWVGYDPSPTCARGIDPETIYEFWVRTNKELIETQKRIDEGMELKGENYKKHNSNKRYWKVLEQIHKDGQFLHFGKKSHKTHMKKEIELYRRRLEKNERAKKKFPRLFGPEDEEDFEKEIEDLEASEDVGGSNEAPDGEQMDQEGGAKQGSADGSGEAPDGEKREGLEGVAGEHGGAGGPREATEGVDGEDLEGIAGGQDDQIEDPLEAAPENVIDRGPDDERMDQERKAGSEAGAGNYDDGRADSAEASEPPEEAGSSGEAPDTGARGGHVEEEMDSEQGGGVDHEHKNVDAQEVAEADFDNDAVPENVQGSREDEPTDEEMERDQHGRAERGPEQDHNSDVSGSFEAQEEDFGSDKSSWDSRDTSDYEMLEDIDDRGMISEQGEQERKAYADEAPGAPVKEYEEGLGDVRESPMEDVENEGTSHKHRGEDDPNKDAPRIMKNPEHPEYPEDPETPENEDRDQEQEAEHRDYDDDDALGAPMASRAPELAEHEAEDSYDDDAPEGPEEEDDEDLEASVNEDDIYAAEALIEMNQNEHFFVGARNGVEPEIAQQGAPANQEEEINEEERAGNAPEPSENEEIDLDAPGAPEETEPIFVAVSELANAIEQSQQEPAEPVIPRAQPPRKRPRYELTFPAKAPQLHFSPNSNFTFNAPFYQKIVYQLGITNPSEQQIVFTIDLKGDCIDDRMSLKPSKGELGPGEKVLVDVALEPFEYRRELVISDFIRFSWFLKENEDELFPGKSYKFLKLNYNF